MNKENLTHTTQIRKAVPDDAAAICSVISAALVLYCTNSGIEKTQLAAGTEDLESIRSLIQNSLFYVLEENGAVIGTIRLSFPQMSELSENPAPGVKEPICYISRFYVHPSHHGKGIGHKLLQFSEKKAAEKNCHALFLHTALKNKKLVGFYAKRGFSLFENCESAPYPRGLFWKL